MKPVRAIEFLNGELLIGDGAIETALGFPDFLGAVTGLHHLVLGSRRLHRLLGGRPFFSTRPIPRLGQIGLGLRHPRELLLMLGLELGNRKRDKDLTRFGGCALDDIHMVYAPANLGAKAHFLNLDNPRQNQDAIALAKRPKKTETGCQDEQEQEE
jgi:hypothetical protein